ncbi:MAG: SDR family oxidoreductase [Pseudomonadota bacterium]
MKTAIVTGAASGIGAAVRQQLSQAGMRVIGIDLRHSDICADLSSEAGRSYAINAALRLSENKIDALVCSAGLGPQAEPAAAIAAVNYFGVVALLDGLFDALKAGCRASAVVVSSSSATLQSWTDSPLRHAYLDGDEEQVTAMLAAMPEEQAGYAAYASSKNAVAVAVRQRAASWGAAGVRLNAVAPGAVQTPLLEAGLSDPRYGAAIRNFVAPIGARAQPGDIAALIRFLASDNAPFIHGSVLFADGGIDATMRPFDF